MADNDQSINNLRYNQVTQGLEGFGGGTPMWTPLVLSADGGINQLTGEVTAGPGTGSQVATVSNAAVIGKVITGYVSGAGTVAATDTILQAINKLNGNTAGKLSSALTSLHTFAGVAGVATDTSVLQVDTTHNSVGIGRAPDSTGTYQFDVQGIIRSESAIQAVGDMYCNSILIAPAGAYTSTSGGFTIHPGGDSTTGIAITKADGTTNVMVVDTTNNQVTLVGAPKFPTGSVAGTGTITPNAYAQSTLIVNVSGATTINGPTNGYDGQKLTFRIVNDGSHSVALATGSGNFSYGTTVTGYTNSASTIDYIGVIYDLANTVWHVVSLAQGY